MNFYESLILNAIILFIISIILLQIVRNMKKNIPLKLGKNENLFFYTYFFMSCVFFLFSLLYLNNNLRNSIWFLMFAFIGILSLYFGSSFITRYKNYSFLVIILLVIFQSMIPIMQNYGMVYGPDQWRDVVVTKNIMETGTLKDASNIGASYYSFIPLFNVFNAIVTTYTGWSIMSTFGVIQIMCCVLSSLYIYIIIMNLTENNVIALSGIMLLLSTPRVFGTSIPSNFSMSIGLLLIVFVVKKNAFLYRNIIALLPVASFVISVIHPIGVFPFIGICIGIIIIKYISFSNKFIEKNISYVKSIFTISLLTIVVYWTTNYKILSSIFFPLKRLFYIFTSTESFSSIYTPQYASIGFEIFSFNWAVPVALSAAFIISILINNKKGKILLDLDYDQIIFTVAASVGLLLIFIAFLSILINPGAAIERYLSKPAYTLLILTSSFVVGKFILSGKKVVMLFAILLLTTNLYIGSSSPGRAPFENPSFGAFVSTYTSYFESTTIITMLPKNSYIYQDNDMPLFQAAQIKNMNFSIDPSYQTIRYVIQQFKNNTYSSLNKKYNNAIITIKTQEILDQRVFNKLINVPYSNGRHLILITK